MFRIAKNNLAYILLKDTFSVLGGSRCKVFISVRSERCFSPLKTFRKTQKDIVEFYLILVVLHICIKECLWDRTSHHQFGNHIKCNFRLFTKQKYCEAIMDDLLLFTQTKKSHIAKLEDLLKALL